MSTPAPPTFSWPRFITAAYGPSFLSTIGYGAVTPLVAFSALHLGASIGLSALITGLTGIGQIAGDLPASWVATRFGEKKAIALACVWDALWLGVAFLATSLPLLSVAVFAFGLSGSVFGLARQSYITESMPAKFRARALSSLGGTSRIGGFIGPLIGSAIIATWNLQAAYAFAALMSLFAAAVTMLLPDLPQEVQDRRSDTHHGPTLRQILADHRHTFATLGVGVLFVGLIRAVRQTVLPLWCESLGMDAANASLVYAVSMGIDMSLFFFGGFIMDRFGRMWVAVPSMVVLGLGLASLALAHSIPAVIVVAIVLGLGNGIGAGIVMTLGSDASPAMGRTQFLSEWRLFGDTGGAAGPVILSGITAATSLAVATVSMGALALVGAAWLGYWIHHSAVGGHSERRGR
ncbi:MAG: MFS transporter [Propionibacteriaceae bacterium]|jgi:MFS family permease|nr:MFS transporter [Propionibacteriaceae bacterium]